MLPIRRLGVLVDRLVQAATLIGCFPPQRVALNRAGLSIRVIAEIMAWSEDEVEKMIRKYVGRAAATAEAIRQLNQNSSAKPSAKLLIGPQ